MGYSKLYVQINPLCFVPDFTWQAMTGVSFQAANWVDLSLVYRHLEWDLGPEGSDGLIKNVNFSGPAFGAVFHF